MPTRNSLAITDRVLSGFALDYGKQELVNLSGSGFGNTAQFIFPQISHNVEGLTGEYYKYNFNNKLQLHDDFRKEGNYNKIEWDVTSETYRLEDFGLSHEYDDREQESAFAPINLSEDAADILSERVLRAYANEAIVLATTSGSFNAGVTNTNTASTLGGAWDTSSTDLIKQVNTAKRVILLNSGVVADRIATSMDVWTNGIMINDGIQAGLGNMQKAAGASDFENAKAIFRGFFGLDGAVDTTVYDSANVEATDSNAFLFPKSVLIFASKVAVDRAKAMRFGFTAVRPGEFMRGYKWFEEPHTNWRAVSLQRSVKLVADDCAYLITSVVT